VEEVRENGLRQFRATVRVLRGVEGWRWAEGVEGADTARGYFRSFGVTAACEQTARRLVELLVDDGTVDWAASELVAIDDEKVSQLLGPRRPDHAAAHRGEIEGAWYRSGRVYY